MIIPLVCIYHIRNCTEGKIQAILFDFYNKYQFFSEVSGANLLQYLQSIKKNIINTLSESKSFDSYNNYRNMYFSTLYKNLNSLKERYNIKRNYSVQQLQSLLGNFFGAKKRDRKLSDINRKLLTQMDESIYFKMNHIMGKYSSVYPLKSNQDLLQGIQEELEDDIQNFYQQNKFRFNEQSMEIM